jgi:hypothetical protein
MEAGSKDERRTSPEIKKRKITHRGNQGMIDTLSVSLQL